MIVRIDRLPAQRRDAKSLQRQFMKICLPKYDSTCILKGTHHRCINHWLGVGKIQAPTRRIHVFRIIIIFQQYRNAEKRSSPITSSQSIVFLVRNRESIRVESDDGVQGGIVRFDTGDEGLNDPSAGCETSIEGVVDAFNGGFADVIAIELGLYDACLEGEDEAQKLHFIDC